MPADPHPRPPIPIDFDAHRRDAERLRRAAIDRAVDVVLEGVRAGWARLGLPVALDRRSPHRSLTAMPLLTLITHPPVDDPDLRHAVARELTDHTERLLGKRLPVTALAWLAPPLAWFVGGEPVPDGGAPLPGRRTFSLDIRVTAGTNTDAEKAAWIAAAWDTLSHALPGPPDPASYVCVTELPASDWGYGGRTQAERKAATGR